MQTLAILEVHCSPHSISIIIWLMLASTIIDFRGAQSSNMGKLTVVCSYVKVRLKCALGWSPPSVYCHGNTTTAGTSWLPKARAYPAFPAPHSHPDKCPN